MDNRTLGMIPGLQPPEGVPETPQGFARLPTQRELHGIVKGWFANRPNWLSASAVQECDITSEERQELVEVYNKVIDQPEEVGPFNKNETKVFSTGREDDYGAIYTHVHTGLKIGVSYDQHILHGSCVEVPSPTSINVLKHVWVEAWYTGELCECYVDHIDDVRRLVSILHETEASSVRVVVSEEFIRAGLLHL